MAKPGKKRRSRISPERVEAVLAMLPAEVLQELRKPPAPKPKRERGRPPVSLTGKRFGKWMVGPRADKPGRVFYTCLCDCGNLGVVEAANLRRGQSKGCRVCADKDGIKNIFKDWRRPVAGR